MIEIRPFPESRPAESPGSPRPSVRLPALAKHEILEARVVRVTDDQGAMITIKGRNVLAKSLVPLGKDQFLLLRVEQTSPRPLLRLLGVSARSSGATLLMQAAEQNPWRQVLDTLGRSTAASREEERLRGLLGTLSTRLLKAPGREFLREWIEKSGMSFETRLRTLLLQGRQAPEDVNELVSGDLKGLLSRMAGKEGGAYPLLERLLSVIETLQWFNHGSLDQAGKLFLLVPLQIPEGFWTVAQLLIHREDRGFSKEGRERACRMVFLAEFSNLGWVRAEVTVDGKEVGIGFLVESEEASGTLREHLPALIESLKGQGFRVKETGFGTRESDFLKRSLLQEVKGAGDLSFSTFV